MNELGYIKDGVEFINTTLLDKIDRMTKQYLNFGIGVYSDKLFEELYGRPSIKPYKERSRLANSIKGVDFVFEVKEIEGDIQKRTPSLYGRWYT